MISGSCLLPPGHIDCLGSLLIKNDCAIACWVPFEAHAPDNYDHVGRQDNGESHCREKGKLGTFSLKRLDGEDCGNQSSGQHPNDQLINSRSWAGISCRDHRLTTAASHLPKRIAPRIPAVGRR